MELSKLDLASVKIDHAVIIGKRASGKSTLVRHLLDTLFNDIHAGIIVDPSAMAGTRDGVCWFDEYKPE